MLVGLVDDLAVGVAERADRRYVDDLRHLGLERRAEDVLGAGDVRLVHRPVLGLRDAHLVDGGAMDHGVAALHAGLDRAAIAEVAGDELAAEPLERGALLGVADERAHLVAAVAQLRRDAAPDEPGSAGEEDLHVSQPR